MPEASTSIIIDVPPKVIYDVVFDFEKYPKFLSDVREVSLLEKKDQNLVVDFEIQLIKAIRYTLKVSGTPYKKIAWQLVDGELFKKNDGCWMFQEVGKWKTKATYSIDIEFGIFVPGMITKKLVGANLPTMIKRFKERAESLS